MLDGLWRQLGVDAALGKVLGGDHGEDHPLHRRGELAANRAIDPMSKLATAEWGHP